MRLTKKKMNTYFRNFFWLAASYLLAPWFYILILTRRNKSKKNGRILVIPPVKIGDLVCVTPIFKAIKQSRPESHLAVLLLDDQVRRDNAYQLLKYNQQIDQFILSDNRGVLKTNHVLKTLSQIRRQNFDWSFGLNFESMDKIISFWSAIPNRAVLNPQVSGWLPRLLNPLANRRSTIRRHQPALQERFKLLRAIGIDKINQTKEIFITSLEKDKASRFLTDNRLSADQRLIGLAVTAGNKLKEWPLDNFIHLADQLTEQLEAKIIFSAVLMTEK